MPTRNTELAELRRELSLLREEVARLRIPGGGVVDPPPDDWGWWRWRRPRPDWPIPQPGDPAPFDRARFRVVLGLDLREVASRILDIPPQKIQLADVKALRVNDIIGLEPGPVVDPAPDDVGRWVRIDPRFFPTPIPWPGDPAPFDFGRFKTIQDLGVVDAVAKIHGKKAASVKVGDLKKVRVRDLIDDLLGGGHVDPPPIDLGRLAALGRTRIAAPELSPREISAMDADELEASVHRLNAEITRLESLRDLATKRAKAKGRG